MKIKFFFIVSMLSMILFSFFCSSAADEFNDPYEYQLWAINTGYPQGSLTPMNHSRWKISWMGTVTGELSGFTSMMSAIMSHHFWVMGSTLSVSCELPSPEHS